MSPAAGPHHLAQRRITYLLRRASGDLFSGPYGRFKPVEGDRPNMLETTVSRALECSA